MRLFNRNDERAMPAVNPEPDAIPDIQISAALEAAINTVDTLLAAHRQVGTALSGAKAGEENAQRELQDSNARLAAVESGAALNGGEVDSGGRKAHLAARDAVEFAHARVTGLESRLIQSAAALNEAKRVLASEWTAWKAQQAEAMLERYEQALDAFIREMKVVKAAAAVLGHAGRLDSVLRGLALPDPRRPFMDRATPARLKDWPELPAARDVNTRLAHVAARVVPLISDFADAPVAETLETQLPAGLVSGSCGGI